MRLKLDKNMKRAYETHYYKTVFFKHDRNLNGKLPINLILARQNVIHFEPFNLYPQDIFFIKFQTFTFVGRKTLSQLNITGLMHTKKCCQILPHMLLGLFEGLKISENGLFISIKPLSTIEKNIIFNRIKNQEDVDIVYPFPILNNDNKEDILKHSTWDPTPFRVHNLDSGEIILRRYTLQLLSQLNMQGKVIYDPACSTGKFLSEIKKRFPDTYTIGQDINDKMTEIARQKSIIDRLITDDAYNTPLPEESVDFIFIRFLNLSIMSLEDSNRYLIKLGNRCKNGGFIIVFGATPVLLTKDWFIKLGLSVIQTIGFDKEEDSIFQYYVLEKKQRIPELTFENVTFFNTIKSPQPDEATHQNGMVAKL